MPWHAHALANLPCPNPTLHAQAPETALPAKVTQLRPPHPARLPRPFHAAASWLGQTAELLCHGREICHSARCSRQCESWPRHLRGGGLLRLAHRGPVHASRGSGAGDHHGRCLFHGASWRTKPASCPALVRANSPWSISSPISPCFSPALASTPWIAAKCIRLPPARRYTPPGCFVLIAFLAFVPKQ
jgi:hypothetical protein